MNVSYMDLICGARDLLQEPQNQTPDFKEALICLIANVATNPGLTGDEAIEKVKKDLKINSQNLSEH